MLRSTNTNKVSCSEESSTVEAVSDESGSMALNGEYSSLVLGPHRLGKSWLFRAWKKITSYITIYLFIQVLGPSSYCILCGEGWNLSPQEDWDIVGLGSGKSPGVPEPLWWFRWWCSDSDQLWHERVGHGIFSWKSCTHESSLPKFQRNETCYWQRGSYVPQCRQQTYSLCIKGLMHRIGMTGLASASNDMIGQTFDVDLYRNLRIDNNPRKYEDLITG